MPNWSLFGTYTNEMSIPVDLRYYVMLKITMNKTPRQVTKNPKRQNLGKRSNDTYMKRLKEDILKDNQLSASSFFCISVTGSFMPATSSFTTRFSDVFIYDIGAVTVI